MAIRHEIDVLIAMLTRALTEEKTSLEQIIPFCDQGTDHIINRITENNEMIRSLAMFKSQR